MLASYSRRIAAYSTLSNRPRWRLTLGAAALLTIAGLAGCGSSQPSATDKGAEAALTESGETPSAGPQAANAAPVVQLGSAREVLAAMADAYRRARTYADNGTVRLVTDTSQGKDDRSVDFSVVMERPNKLRMNVYDAAVACDGQQWHAAVKGLPDQVVVRKAPAQLSFSAIYADFVLASVLSQGYAGPPPQLTLLLHPDAVSALLQGADEPTLGQPGTVGDRTCYRVEIGRRDGKAVFWIDQQTLVLRRIIYPVDEMRQMLAASGATVNSLSLVADFTAARLDSQPDPKAFQFEVPATAETVEFFLPPNPWQLLGKPLPELQLTDLDGNAVTAQSLAGRINLLVFCTVSWTPSLAGMPAVSKAVAEAGGGNRVAVYAVCVDDQRRTSGQDIQAALKDAGVPFPVLRDTNGAYQKVLKSGDTPCLFIVDAKGVLQDFISVAAALAPTATPASLADGLGEKLGKLLQGQDIFPDALAAYQQRLATYGEKIDEAYEGRLPEAAPMTQDIPYAEVAPKSQPQHLRLSSLWTCAEVQAPGNLLVVPAADGSARLVVIDGWRSVAEVGLDGKLIATHPLEMDESEVACNLRTAVGADGRRYYALFASAQQRCHVFDQQWKKLFSYPEDALEHPHDGIADVEFADLDGDGVLELYVSYWGVVGVQAVSLDGQRTGANRSLSYVTRMGATGPDAQGRRRLVCTNSDGTLVVLDDQLEGVGNVSVQNRPISWLTTSGLDTPEPHWCGLAGQLGENLMIGFTLDGQELWSYTLPPGVPRQPIEQVVAGRITAAAPGQWLLPGPDGSIHILGADGRLIDRFNYGATLNGLATVHIGGRPALLIASEKTIEALAVE